VASTALVAAANWLGALWTEPKLSFRASARPGELADVFRELPSEYEERLTGSRPARLADGRPVAGPSRFLACPKSDARRNILLDNGSGTNYMIVPRGGVARRLLMADIGGIVGQIGRIREKANALVEKELQGRGIRGSSRPTDPCWLFSCDKTSQFRSRL